MPRTSRATFHSLSSTSLGKFEWPLNLGTISGVPFIMTRCQGLPESRPKTGPQLQLQSLRAALEPAISEESDGHLQDFPLEMDGVGLWGWLPLLDSHDSLSGLLFFEADVFWEILGHYSSLWYVPPCSTRSQPVINIEFGANRENQPWLENPRTVSGRAGLMPRMVSEGWSQRKTTRICLKMGYIWYTVYLPNGHGIHRETHGNWVTASILGPLFSDPENHDLGIPLPQLWPMKQLTATRGQS